MAGGVSKTGATALSVETTADIERLLREARRHPLVPPSPAGRAPLLDRAAIEARLPHRGASLLLDAVTHHDVEAGTIAATRNVAAAELAGHFPGQPVWPGVLQVEAIGQAGALLAALAPPADESGPPLLTEIVRAYFLRAVSPGSVDIAARLFEDGLFFVIVGQCLQAGRVCSVAAVRGVKGMTE